MFLKLFFCDFVIEPTYSHRKVKHDNLTTVQFGQRNFNEIIAIDKFESLFIGRTDCELHNHNPCNLFLDIYEQKQKNKDMNTKPQKGIKI